MDLTSSATRKGHVRQGHLTGFTLIELLVVIAIIGILSSVVLASLNTARNKGADAAVKSNLSEARAQAELYYDANSNSYAGVCSTTAVNGVKTINASVLAASQASGLGAIGTVAYNTAQTAGTSACHDSTTTWAASAPLKTSTAVFFCIDNTGAAATTTNVLAVNTAVCS